MTTLTPRERRSGVERRTVDPAPTAFGQRDRRSSRERRSGTDRSSGTFTCIIDRGRKLVTTVWEGVVTVELSQEYFGMFVKDRSLAGFNTLADLTGVKTFELMTDDLAELVSLSEALYDHSTPTKTAIVATGTEAVMRAEVFGVLRGTVLGSTREMRVFADRKTAERWLTEDEEFGFSDS